MSIEESSCVDSPSCRELREVRFNAGERICIGCGTKTPDTYGGLCIECDVAEDETNA